MTTGQNYVGKADNANSIEQTDSINESAVQNGTLSVGSQPPQTHKGDLLADFNISVNARGSSSAADVLIFALTEYQTSRLKQATQEMASGEWGNAAESLSDSETAAGMITELALSLSRLADKNFWASQNEAPEGKNYDPYSNFRSQAKHAFGWSDEQINQYAEANL